MMFLVISIVENIDLVNPTVLRCFLYKELITRRTLEY